MDFLKFVKNAVFKRVFLLLALLFAPLPEASACYLTHRATDPCVLLWNKEGWVGLSFCSNATSCEDLYGRSIPRPCEKFGAYVLDCDQLTDSGRIVPWVVLYHLEVRNGAEIVIPYYFKPAKSNIGNSCDQPDYQPTFQDPVLPPESEGFLGSTIVQTEFGPRSLNLIEVGDSVVSFDLNQGTWVNTRVIQKPGA